MSRPESVSSNGDDIPLPATWDTTSSTLDSAMHSLIGYNAPMPSTGLTPSPNTRMAQQLAQHTITSSSIPLMSSPLAHSTAVASVPAPLGNQPMVSSSLSTNALATGYLIPTPAHRGKSTSALSYASPSASLQNSPYQPKPSARRRISQKSSSTPTKSCNCKNSKCLKLYCDCFAHGGYCGPNCNCSNCQNTVRVRVLSLNSRFCSCASSHQLATTRLCTRYHRWARRRGY
eukprot:TRINITY_DN11605_c0_g1_i4.p1 TRINITY_DN11605_c0_g1~~TRINITY_DN11605_c0_g1_i4.p1  ORF type:complete len:231 (+),score=7.43 TRINITY_DN11605_c0_g1_i4:333-1025(+)